jgi:hypothetical protein
MLLDGDLQIGEIGIRAAEAEQAPYRHFFGVM